ncbi:MAG: cell division protein FtsQ/DivIB [Proteobacteria bacterium]|nr:cell division protein FtsQ/DivIB [Pseudomonadota bacterium]
MWHNYRALNKISYGLLLLLCLYLCQAVFKAGVNLEFFQVSRINFIGDIDHVSREQLESIVTKRFKGGFFNLNLREAKDSLERLPWINTVQIKRIWPDAIEVFVTEKNAIARWEGGGLLDGSGKLFEGALDAKLPILEGPDGQHIAVVRKYLSLSAMLEPHAVRIDRLRLTKHQSWYGRLSSGIVVAFGKENVESRLERFMRFLPDVELRFKQPVKYADLRYTNGFAVNATVSRKDGS